MAGQKRTVFIDVEASGLRGFPIQIGWAVVGSPNIPIHSDAVFIRHDPWLAQIELWDPAAEALHGISRDLLVAQGLSIAEVAGRLDTLFKGETLYADSVESDARWIDMLFSEAGTKRSFRIADIAVAMANTDEVAYGEALRKVDKIAPQTHRADQDARHWAVLFDLARIRHR
jgi:hypothetical protein